MVPLRKQQDTDRIAGYLEYAAWWVREGAAKFETWKSGARNAGGQARADAILAGADSEGAERAALERVLQIPFDPPAGIEEPEKVDEIIRGSDPEAWDLLRKLVSSAPNEPSILGFIGAGLFENWVQGERAEPVIADLLELIRHDSKWQAVAAHCWHNPTVVVELLRSL